MQYGKAATELLRELQRDKKQIPPYNDVAMRAVIQESNDLISISRAHMTSYARGGQLPVEILPALYLEQGAVNWNKRCALAYLDERINRIQQLWWQTNGLLNNNNTSPQPTHTTTTTTTAANNNTHLAPHELQYFNDYNRLILTYIQRTDLPLTADQTPPRAVWLTVEVLSEGRIEGADGTPMELKAGNRKRMRRMDAENLVRQGIVRVVSDSVV